MAALAGGDVGAAATVARQRRRLGEQPDPVRQHGVAPAGRIAVEVVQPERVLRELLALEAEQVLEHAALAVVPGIEPRDHRVDAARVAGRQLRHRPEIERPGRVAAPRREVAGEEVGERREIGARVREERVGDREVAAQLPDLGLRPRRQGGERPLRADAVGRRQAVAERQVIEAPAPARADRRPVVAVERLAQRRDVVGAQPAELDAHALEVEGQVEVAADEDEPDLLGTRRQHQLAVLAGRQRREGVALRRVEPAEAERHHVLDLLERGQGGEEEVERRGAAVGIGQVAVQPGGIVEDVAPGRGPVRAGGAAVAHQPPAAIVDQRGEALGRVAPAHLDAGLEPAGDRHRQRQAAQVLAEVAAGVEGAAHGGERRLRVGIGLRHDVQVVEPCLGAMARAHQHPLDRGVGCRRAPARGRGR